jgi:protein-tyrosine-phosphatase
LSTTAASGPLHPPSASVVAVAAAASSRSAPRRRDQGLRRHLAVHPGKRYIDWDLPDPKGRPVDEVRATCDGIERRVDALLGELDQR